MQAVKVINTQTNMSRWLKIILSCFLIAILTGCNKRGGLQIDDTVPHVTLPDFKGKSVELPKNGKVILVRFWSLECGFCDKEMLFNFENLYQKYKQQGFIPVAVNVSLIDANDERLKRFEPLTYSMLVDERGVVANKFGVIALPTTFLIDDQGRLQKKISGEASIEELESHVTKLLPKGNSNE